METIRSSHSNPSPTHPMSTERISVTPSGTVAEAPWPTSSYTVICWYTQRLGVTFSFFIYRAYPSRIPTLSLSSRKRLRSEEHTSELQSRFDLVCRLLLEKKNVPY